MQRFLVIGSGGAGKSTFAMRLAERTGLPLIHLDALYWRAGWIEPAKAEWAARVEQLVTAERWIMDGNFGGTLERRFAACDTVIFLDLSRWLCLWRVLIRRVRYRGQVRPAMAAGCHERLSLRFIGWILGYPQKHRPMILQRLAEMRAEQRVIVLRTPREVANFLESVACVSPPAA
ncbi:DNA topology modulation protein [Pseudolysobacter antarcticus]|uniref:DNA topology modulation protein n=2 Tax=Pseudolysobacter antarcticus TaxID=2511995 RepID=A0A411HPX8_9GAMM|nr:DNA topology modulation protein [Pseudolysobacter antarcticus]